MELWKDIKGYEGYYQVSNLGNVRSVDRTVKRKGNGTSFSKGQIIKLQINKRTGYCKVNLCKEGKSKTYEVHRLVAVEFLENSDNLPVVNHLNGVKTDNFVENLEWCTYKQNTQHAHDIGLVSPKVSIDDVRWIKENYIARDEFYGAESLSVMFNVSKGHIGNILCGQARKNIV